jgi:hypothetical protein
MTVWLVNSVKDDTSAALKWGEIRWISPRYIYGDELDEDGNIPPDFYVGMQSAANAFNPTDDYLLIAGDHLQLVTMAAMLGTRHPKFRVLRYDRQAQGYLPVWVRR